MRCYQIDQTQITVHATMPADAGDGVLLSKASELDPKRFPVARLLALYNRLPGIERRSRFPDRQTAIKTFWSALTALPLGPVSGDSKQQQILTLLRRPEGCDLEGLMEATGWQRHSVRGFLSAVVRKRLGLPLESIRSADRRGYRIPV